MKRYVTKKTKPIVKITLGLITASISLGTISVVTQQATAHASTVQTTHNHTSTQNQTRTPSTAPHISHTKTPVKRVTTTVKAPTAVKTTTKVATVKQPTQTVKTVSVSAPKTSQTSTIKTSTSHTQKPTSAKAPTSTHHKSSATPTKHSTTTKPTVSKPSTTKSTNMTKHTKTTPSKSTTSSKTSTTTRPPSQTSKTISKASTSTVKSTSQSSTKTSTPTASSKKSVTPTTSTPTQASASSKETTLPSTGVHSDAKPIMPIENAHKDYYASMTQLERETKEGIDWKKETRDQGNQVLIVAPHGGNIEQGTSELTKLLAQQGDYDYFSFEATRPSNNTQLHVTSTHYDDPTLHQMIKGRAATISIHGAKGDDQIVFLGGAKSDLRDAIQSQLESRGFVVQVPPEYLGGLNENNFINKNENSTGVQLELTTALRKALFINKDMSTSSRKNEENWSPLMYQFADALHMAISQTTETSTH